jgi:hypothetical protein
MQIDLFEAEQGARWRQLPEEARQQVIELLARVVVECIGQRAGESEGDDDDR